jgi:hypothetical protein
LICFKAFWPISLLLLTTGALKTAYDVFARRFHFAPSTVIVILTALQVAALGLLADLIDRRMAK